jgi:ABC-type transport system involved in multi-copper enzyme maturation permease subunit
VRAATLIATNFLRENRWAIVLLMVWAFGSGIGAVLSVHSSLDDAMFFLHQQAAYSVFFSVFLAASAIYNQRRSRRILAVLSKGIGRSEYLGGIVLGFTAVSAMYTLALAITGAWTFAAAGANPLVIVPLAIILFVASTLAGTTALLFSTIFNPLLTLAATSAALGAAAFFAHTVPIILPAYSLLERVMTFGLQQDFEIKWTLVVWALIEAVALWGIASAIFSRRDIAVPVE